MAIREQFEHLSAPELEAMLEHPQQAGYPLYTALGHNFRLGLDSPYEPQLFHAVEANRHYLVGRSFSERYPTVALYSRTEASHYDKTGIGQFRRRISMLSLWQEEPETTLVRMLAEDRNPKLVDHFYPEDTRGVVTVEDRIFHPATKSNMRWSYGNWMGFMAAVSPELYHQIIGFGPNDLIDAQEDNHWIFDLEYYFNELYNPD